MNPPGEAPALDPEVLAMLRELAGDDDPDLLHDLVESFAQDSPARVEAVERGVREGDAETVRQAAHTLKSSAANLGAKRLSVICARLEAEAREGHLDRAAELATRLRPEYDSALELLRREVGPV